MVGLRGPRISARRLMDHNEALRLHAVEKYVLGELPPSLRDEFEQHFFECQECALDVRAAAANQCVWICNRSVFVFLILKHVRIDRTGLDTMLLCQIFYLARVLQPIREVPLNVQCQSRACASHRMYLSGVAKFFFNGAGGSELDELAKSRAGVRKAPRGQLYSKIVERLPHRLRLPIPHRDLKPCR
ncbi:MAG: hypothetical protein DMG48_01380 [Acidobacteria bacterium]|nr:MAG: hypothetical protein DMG48_01380 [Acidobacteriota bacterium]